MQAALSAPPSLAPSKNVVTPANRRELQKSLSIDSVT